MVVRICLVGLSLAVANRAWADWWSTLFPHDVDVVTFTEMTEAGRAYPNATPANPVYYKIIDLGLQYFGEAWDGESIPNRREVRKWMMTAMARQGYLLADEPHPPTQLFVFSWGMLRGGPGALRFLGGDVTEAIFRGPSFLPVPRTGIAQKVWDTAEGYVFLVMVRSYTIDSESAPKVTLLWETRFGCPATGLALSSTMPLMIKAAAPHLGRETKLPVNLNVSDLLRSRVDLGELKVIEMDVPVKLEPEAKPYGKR